MVNSPVSRQQRMSHRTLHRILLAACVTGIVLVIAGTGWYLYNVNRQAAAEASLRQSQEQARYLAQQLDQPFAAVRKQLAALAKEAQIVSLFKEGDAIEVASQAAEYRGRFPGALNMRFFLPGGYALDENSVPPLGYASLELLKKAENSGGPVAMVALLFGKPNQHIVLVQRVRGRDGRLLGLMHLSLGVDLFKKSLAGLKLVNSYVELQQSVGGRTLVLASGGDAAYKKGDPVFVSLTNSRWGLAYWQGEKTGKTTLPGEMDLLLMAGGGVVLILMLAGVVVVARKRRTAGQAQAKTGDAAGVVYAGAVRNIMDGAHPGLENLVPHLPGGEHSGPQAEPSAALWGAEDITQMNNPSRSKQNVKAEDMFDISGGTDIEVEEIPPETAAVTTEPPTTTKPPAAPAAPKAPAAPEPPAVPAVSPAIFRAYDIRGVVGKTLTPGVVESIGRSIGSEAGALGEKTVIVGRDGRNSSPELSAALIKGICAAGRDVIDVGMVPTPVLYYAVHALDANSGVMVTGSHNGPEYNGLKIVLAGDTLSDAGIQKIYRRITTGELESGRGTVKTAEILADYIRRITEDIPVALGRSLNIVIDCGNGVPGMVAPQLFRALGHEVVELYCDVDGNFPNHHPDPSQPENLAPLIEKVKTEGADLGLAFDGDGDRVGVIDGNGKIIWPDRQLMVLARDVLSRNPGAEIIFDVKCSRHLNDIIVSSGGKPLMWKTGHSLIKRKMKEDNAPLAGEMSGHIFFKERWYGFDDAMYAAARLVEVILNAGVKPAELFAEIPEGVSTPELRIDLSEEQHQTVMQELENAVNFADAKVIKVDGLRIEFADGWGLIRPSNTTPCLVLRFEADNAEALARIEEAFRGLIHSINPDLKLPF
jgi:phosphomannomutase/phosphoglucomutase